MKFFKITLLLLVLSTLQVYSQTSSSDIDNLLEDATTGTKNAAYLNVTDLYGSGSLFIGYQRSLIKDFWAEAGVGIGIRKIKTKKDEQNAILEIGSPLRYLVTDKIEDFPTTASLGGAQYTISPKTAFELGVYKNIMGEDVSGVWSIGLYTRFASYDIEYVYNHPSSLIGDIEGQNTMGRTSIYASLVYKMELSRKFGIDYTAGVGPTFINLKDSGVKDDLYSSTKYTLIDYVLTLKFYYLF